MKLDHLLFVPRVRGNVVAFPSQAPRIHAVRAPLHAHWTLDPQTRLPACHWDACAEPCAKPPARLTPAPTR